MGRAALGGSPWPSGGTESGGRSASARRRPTRTTTRSPGSRAPPATCVSRSAPPSTKRCSNVGMDGVGPAWLSRWTRMAHSLESRASRRVTARRSAAPFCTGTATTGEPRMVLRATDSERCLAPSQVGASPWADSCHLSAAEGGGPASTNRVPRVPRAGRWAPCPVARREPARPSARMSTRLANPVCSLKRGTVDGGPCDRYPFSRRPRARPPTRSRARPRGRVWLSDRPAG
jgi:hypothetical protein